MSSVRMKMTLGLAGSAWTMPHEFSSIASKTCESFIEFRTINESRCDWRRPNTFQSLSETQVYTAVITSMTSYLCDPGGITARSRWLSASDTTGSETQRPPLIFDPGRGRSLLQSLPGWRKTRLIPAFSGGVADAQPPATSDNSSGITARTTPTDQFLRKKNERYWE